MATIQVIIHGVPGGTVHDTDEYPVILHFEEGNDYEEASWVIPSFPGYIPGEMLSEIRVIHGPLKVMIDGSDGFTSGPYEAGWIRGGYPRGKLASFMNISEGRNVYHVTVDDGEIHVQAAPPAPTPAAG